MAGAVPADDVLLHEDEGEAMLLHVSSGRYFGLNRSGVVVWHALVAGDDPAAALHATWPRRSLEECETDAKVLIDDLVRTGLARVPDDDRSS